MEHKHKLVQLAGLAGGVTIGLPVGMSSYDVEVNDPFSGAAADNLSGYFSIHALGFTPGYTVEADITIGSAKGKVPGGWGVSGIGAGFDNFWGLTTPIMDVGGCYN